SGAAADEVQFPAAAWRDVGAGGIDRLQPASTPFASLGLEEEAKARAVVRRTSAHPGGIESAARNAAGSVWSCRCAARGARADCVVPQRHGTVSAETHSRQSFGRY